MTRYEVEFPEANGPQRAPFGTQAEALSEAKEWASNFPGDKVKVYRLELLATVEVPKDPEPVVTYTKITDNPKVVLPIEEANAIASSAEVARDLAISAAEEAARGWNNRKPGPTRGPRREAA